MENASKALVIAGSILIAILIIGAATFMFRDLTTTQRELESSKITEQINEFNKQYTAYEKELYGHELLSLINKMEDYNKKIDNENSGYTKMKMTVTNLTTGSLITSNSYSNFTPGASNPFRELVKAKNIPKDKGVLEEDFQRLVDLWFETSPRAQTQLEQLLDNMQKTRADFTDTEVKKYSEYVDFKRNKFKHVETKYDQNSRIIFMSYKQK